MKRIFPLLLCALILFSGCGSAPESSSRPSEPEPSAESSRPVSSVAETTIYMTDSDGNSLEFNELPDRVVSLYGSYAEAWMLAGGTLAGCTEDAVKERKLDLPESVSIVGTVKEPNAEEIIALDPGLVLLSSDITAQTELRATLENAAIPCLSFRVDTFEDYDYMMQQFTALTGRTDLYEENVAGPRARIEEIKTKAGEAEGEPSVLLIRAFSSGIKAKTDDELAGVILKELGCRNIADEHPSMLEDLSMEEVISQNPDYLFVTTMGNEQKALDYLDSLIAASPAWSELDAVKSGRYVILPKDLFHYKPNNRWDESYEYLAKILYPELFA